MQNCSISTANKLEILQSCIESSIWSCRISQRNAGICQSFIEIIDVKSLTSELCVADMTSAYWSNWLYILQSTYMNYTTRTQIYTRVFNMFVIMTNWLAWGRLQQGLLTSSMNSPNEASDAELSYILRSAPCINDWVNNPEGGDLSHHRAHYYVILMKLSLLYSKYWMGITYYSTIIYLTQNRII